MIILLSEIFFFFKFSNMILQKDLLFYRSAISKLEISFFRLQNKLLLSTEFIVQVFVIQL